MTAALSVDLRERVVRSIEAGLSARAAGRHFGVGESTAVRWHRQWRETGRLEPAT